MHAALSAAVAGELSRSLRGTGHTVYSSDQRLTPRPGESMYADAIVACPRAAAPPHAPRALANPVPIAEVLSLATADWDMGGKFRLYREFASLRHYLLLHTDAWLVVHHERRDGDTCRTTEHGSGSSVTLSALGTTVAVGGLYAEVFAQGAALVTRCRGSGLHEGGSRALDRYRARSITTHPSVATVPDMYPSM
jgi:Uma2 family endonuclease